MGCGQRATPKPSYKISDEFKAYCLFQPGSTWDYYTSDSNDTASLQLEGITEDVWYNNAGELYFYEAINMYFDTTNLNTTYWQITAGSTKNSSSTMNSIMRIFNADGSFRLVFDASYPLGEEQLVGENEGAYTNIEIIPTMELRGNTYSEVYHSKVTDYYNQGFGDFDFYIAKNHGIIKIQNIVNNDTIITELINSSPIQ